MQEIEVRRLDLGYFIRPGGETTMRRVRVEPCLAYLVVHPTGVLLFDTGMGSRPDVDSHYRPNRQPLELALSRVGATLDDVTAAANCHLHFDHCGGNPLLGRRPVFVQRSELSTARGAADYTLPELVEGGYYVEVDGDHEITSGVMLVPTPGHTPGHQSLVVRRRDGVVVVAGQSHDSATEYSADVLGLRAAGAGDEVKLLRDPAWVARLANLDPRTVYFAHDHSVWVP